MKCIMNKTFVRVRSAKDIIISSSLIILGCVLIALPTGSAINITGFFMICAGILLVIILHTGYKDVETGCRYSKVEHYFQQEMNHVIKSALESKPETIDLTQADKGNAVKLDIYFSKTSGKAYLQLFEYIPYDYEPCSKMYEYDVNKVANIIR